MRTWHDNNVQSNAPCRQVLTVQLNYLASLAKVFVYELRVVGLYPIAVTLTLSYAANKWKCFTHENNHEKKLLSNKIPLKKYLLTHEIPSRKTLGPTKYLQEKVLDEWHTHNKKYWTYEIPMKAGLHDGHRTHEIHINTSRTKFSTLL